MSLHIPTLRDGFNKSFETTSDYYFQKNVGDSRLVCLVGIIGTAILLSVMINYTFNRNNEDLRRERDRIFGQFNMETALSNSNNMRYKLYGSVWTMTALACIVLLNNDLLKFYEKN